MILLVRNWVTVEWKKVGRTYIELASDFYFRIALKKTKTNKHTNKQILL